MQNHFLELSSVDRLGVNSGESLEKLLTGLAQTLMSAAQWHFSNLISAHVAHIGLASQFLGHGLAETERSDIISLTLHEIDQSHNLILGVLETVQAFRFHG